MLRFVLGIVSLATFAALGVAAEPDRTPAERGKELLTGTAFIKGFWPRYAYDNAWRNWGVMQKPTDYATAFRDRYGLHAAPYPNGDLPMGLRKADLLIGSGLGIDCMTCHGGSIFGKSYVGLGNASLDLHALFDELGAAGGNPLKLKYAASQVRGTNEAGSFSVYLLGFRNPDLTIAEKFRDLGLKDDSCEDVPAWWLLKKKRTMYYVGATDARSVRSIMQFMMHPLTTRAEFDKAEPAFRDIMQYILSLEPPKYPFPMDAVKANAGKTVFADYCVRCHGTHGEDWKYPNKIIPLDEIGTDQKRFDNIGQAFAEAYNASWFAQEGSPEGKPVSEAAGYQAPPLDGVWATAPYLHNGSVPTLEALLNSKTRPKVFTRSYRTGVADYDKDRVGWKVTEVPLPDPGLPGIERRKVYDTTQPGRGNGGHTYGDDLTTDERAAVIEYLKAL